jgi:hypothetical protein
MTRNPQPQEGEMATWDNLPILIALPLALAAACMSGNAEARQQISRYIVEALTPQVIDLGGDSNDPFGTANDTIWPFPIQLEAAR